MSVPHRRPMSPALPGLQPPSTQVHTRLHVPPLIRCERREQMCKVLLGDGRSLERACPARWGLQVGPLPVSAPAAQLRAAARGLGHLHLFPDTTLSAPENHLRVSVCENKPCTRTAGESRSLAHSPLSTPRGEVCGPETAHGDLWEARPPERAATQPALALPPRED